MGFTDRIAKSVVGAAGTEVEGEQDTIHKTVKIQGKTRLPCLKSIKGIVPKAKGSKWRGNKTDTIITSHVDINFLFVVICDCVGIIGSAHHPAERAVRLVGCGRRRNAGIGQCFHLDRANSL